MNLIDDYHVRLKEKRVERKWMQEKAAKEIGISRSYYSDIENGRAIPSGKLLFIINEIFPIFLSVNDGDTFQLREVKDIV